MIEFHIAGLKSNIEAKLNTIKMSNALYFHIHKQEYESLCRKFKMDNMQHPEKFKMDLEGLLISIDDTVRGDK